MELIELFNAKLLEFMDDVATIDPEFKSAKPMIKMAINMDVRTPIRTLGPHLVKYECSILSKDEQFFLNENYSFIEDAKVDVINRLKKTWVTLSEDNKSVVWKYLHVLILLHKKFIAVQKLT